MNITLNFAFSPDTNGFCKFAPRFDSVDVTNVHDGHQKYASAIAGACVKAAKEAIKTIDREKAELSNVPLVIASCHLQR